MQLEESKPKALYHKMPVINIKAVPVEKSEQKDAYLCPVYKTQTRGPTYVFTAGLRTKVCAALCIYQIADLQSGCLRVSGCFRALDCSWMLGFE